MSRPIRPSSRRNSLAIAIDCLEPRWMMATTSPDTFMLQSYASTYDQPYFFESAQPAVAAIAPDGKSVFDLRTNNPGDQSVSIGVGVSTRIRVDPLASYQFTFIAQAGEGNFTVESFDASGASLGMTTVSYDYVTPEDEYYRLVTARGVIGPSGRTLPANTAVIEFSPPLYATQFGFVEDQVFSFVASGFVDRQQAPIPLRVDVASPLTISYQSIRNAFTAIPQLHTLGFESLDVDGELIEGVHAERFAGSTDTYLAQPLNPGDTSFLVQSAKGWSNQSPDARTRALAWYGYRDSNGTLYPDYSYTRNVARDSIDGVWDQGAIVGNRITLRKPWAGPAIPNGTAVRNAVDSDSLIPALLNNGPVAQAGNATIAGVWQKGQRQSNQFPPGTASIRLASLMNQSSGALDESVTVQLRYGLPAPGFSIGTAVNNRRMVDLDVLANDTSSSALVIRAATQGVRGSVSILPASGAERGKLRYTSPQYFIGSDFFSYTVFDPQTGTESTEQVFLQSLGGNLDQDATLRETVRLDSLVPKPLQGEIYFTGSAVKNERFIPDDRDIQRYPIAFGNTYVTLRYLANQSGSLNLLPSGNFDFEPFKDFVGTVPFVVGFRNGSDERLGTGSLTVFEDRFGRDQSRLAAIGLAEQNHESAYKRLFYSAGQPVDSNNKPFLSWRVHALPYMGYYSLYSRFRLNEPWDSPNNLPLLSEMPNIFRSGTDSPIATTTRYLAIANGSYPNSVPLFLNNANGLGNTLRYGNVTDGLSNTMLVVQAAPEKAIPWTKPDDLTFDAANPLSTLGNVGSYFSSVFADGKVRALPSDMGNAMFRSLATISDGDILQDPASLTRAAKLRADFPGDPITYDDNYQTQVMRNLTLAMFNHESVYKTFAPSSNTTKNLSWRVYLLPYIEQAALFNQFRLDEPWDSPTNLAAAEKMPDIFRSLGDSPASTLTRFRVLGGPNMAYGSANALNQGPRLNQFTDGLSNSMLIVEAGTDKAVPWTKPDVMPIAGGNIWNSLGTFAKPFMLVGMADGATLRIPTSTPPDVVRGLATINLADAGRTEFDIATGTSKQTNAFQQRNDLKNIALGILNFESSFKRLPNDFFGSVTQVAPGAVGLSWRVAILPYIDEGALYNRFHLDEPWDSPHNLTLLPLMPSIFKTATDRPSTTTTRVQRFQGRNTIDPKQRMRLADITDGNSNTVLAALSAPEKAVPWTKPADMEFSDIAGWEALGKNMRHTPAVIADGSTKTLDRSIGNVVLNALVRRNDGMVADVFGDPNVDPPRTLVLREGDAIDAITVSGQMRAFIDFDTPGLAFGFVKSDGYNRGLGASLQVGAVAADNGILDGKRQTKLNVRVLSNPNDPNSPLKLLYSINVIILDNEVAAVLTNTMLPLTVAEGKATEIWIHLGAQPTANVTVTATESDPTEVTIANRTLVFTPSDWFIPQRVIVDGVVDLILDGDIDSEIQFAVTASTDAAFAASSPLVVPVTTLDNRPATLRIIDAVTSLREDTVTTDRIMIGLVEIVDDGIGVNTLSLAGRDAGLFLLENDFLYLRAGTLLDYETKSRLEVIVNVDDPAVLGSPDSSLTHSITITDVNEAPGLTLTSVLSVVPESNTTGLDVANITIQDDALGTNNVTLSGPDAAMFELSGGKLKLRPSSLDFETKPTLRVTVSVDDPTVGTTPDQSVDLVLNVTDVNEAPGLLLTNVVGSVPESNTTGLNVADITIQDDALGTNNVTLSGPDAAMFELSGGKLKLRPSSLDFETRPTLRVTVSVDDPTVGTTPDRSIDLVLNVTDVNEAPGLVLTNVVSVVPESNTTGLDVANIAIRDDALGTNNVALSGPDAAMFELAGGKLKLKPSSLDFETKPTLRVTVSVDDPTVGTTPDQSIELVLNVTDVNEAPGLALTNVVGSVPESNTTGLDVANIALQDDALGTNSVTLSGPDAAMFELAGGKLKLKPSSLDFETKPTLRVTVSVDDPTVGATPDQSIDLVLNVTDVNEAPGLVLTNLVSVVPESNTTGIDVANTVIQDDALGRNNITLSGPDAAMFELSGGKLKLKPSSLDFETKPTLRVTLSVDDPAVGPTPDQSIDLVLNVTDVNDAPGVTLTSVVSVVPESNTTGLDVANITIQDDALGTNNVTLSGPDAAMFELADGKLKLKPSSLDFETRPTLRVTVSVDDPTVGTTPDQSIELVLKVTDVNEVPGLTLANVVTLVLESNSTGLDVANIIIQDDALGTNNVTLSGPDAAMFELAGGKLKLKPSSLDFETKPSLRVTVSVDDPTIGTTPDQSIDLILNVSDVNESPGLVLTNVVSVVPESDTTGLDVANVTIQDDALGTNNVTLSGPDAAMFELAGGKLKLKPSSLDFETKPTLRVTVSVDDPTVGTTPDQSVNIVLNVTDVNDAPGLVLTNVVSVVPESNTTGLDVASISIPDDVLGTNAITLSGPDAAMFLISGGKLKLNPSVLDFENKPTFRVTVSVDDLSVGASPDQSINVVLNVADVNEAPSLTLTNVVNSVSESTSVGLVIADLAIQDDALGDNAIRLSGPNASLFEVSGGKLKLKPGVLDFETKPTLRVTVSVDDPTIGSTPDQSIEVVLNVTDVNEAPTEVVFTNIKLRAPEELTLTEAVVVADISVMDDALGTQQLSLNGADASYFEIVNSKLKIKAGARFNFEVQSTLNVRVEAKDPALANSTSVFRDFTLSIDNVPEVTSVQVVDGSGWNSSVRQVRIGWDTIVTLSDSAIEWKKRDVGNATVSYSVQATVINNRTLADVRFEGKYLDAVGLIDGIYDLNVLGDQVTGAATSLQGLNYSESFAAIRPKPEFAMTIGLAPSIGVGSRVSIPVQLIGLNETGSGIRYEADFDGDGVTDRTLLGGLNVTFSDVAFERGGSQTITVKAIRNSVLLSQGNSVVDVLPYTSRGSRWTSTLDVDGDETISPLDVLVVINWLNDSSSSRLYALNLDVDRDNSISPLDVLNIINHINSSGGSAPTPFSSLAMNDTGMSDGLTSNVGVRGTAKDANSKLFLSLDGSNRKEAVGAIANDGQFELTDAAIAQLFGKSLDGDHLLTIGTVGSDGIWQGMDRRFTKAVRSLSSFEIRSALQNRGVFVEWGSAGTGARYRILRNIAGQLPAILSDGLSSLSAKIDLPTGSHDLYIEAYDRVGNVERSPTLRVTVVSS